MVIVSNRKDPVRTSIDALTAELGEKRGNYYYAEFSVKDVLERAGIHNDNFGQNYVRHVIRTWYPEGKIYPGQADNGGFIKIRIRSI